jgi:NitT/TauT family transport system ATP-binding protein
MTQASIAINNVTKHFPLKGSSDGVVALENVSLTVAGSEFVALLGPSGCGKSTLLRLMASLETASEGTVTISGEAPVGMATRHALGVAFQDHALLPWLSVYDNIALPSSLANRPVEKAAVNDLIKLVGLEGFEQSRPGQLSGGMRQRVSIARSLILSPEVLLLDEPFGALDAVTRRQMNIELQRIWSRQKITTVLVTHSVDEALFLADRILVLSARPGRIVREVVVPFDRPRDPAIMRSEEFHKLVDDLTDALHPDETGDGD